MRKIWKHVVWLLITVMILSVWGQNPGCPTLVAPDNGSVSESTINYGENAGEWGGRFRCNTGYDNTGGCDRPVCGDDEDQTWSCNSTVCTIKDCGNTGLADPLNGVVTYTLTTYGETATYTCNEPFTRIGAASRTCSLIFFIFLTWSPSAPTCDFFCGMLTAPQFGTADSQSGENEIFSGDVVTYDCDPGYVISDSNSRSCSVAGLSGTEPTCSLVDCGSLVAPEDSSVTYALTTYGETAEYTCNANFNLVGAATRTCLADGSWSPTAPSCAFSCGTLTQPLNGIAQTNTGDEEIMLGDVVTYACNNGYVISHSNSRECVITGLTETEPTCSLVDCGNLAAIDYGSVNYVLTTYDETAEYTCNENFTQVGASTRTCLADGSWSPTAPYCEFSCGSLTQPVNGIAQTNTGDVEIMLGDIVTYGCNTGYVISHSNSRECVITGLTGTEPTCSLVDCGNLVAPEYGSVTVVLTTYDETADYACNENFTQVGASTRTCLADGSWSPTAPYCEFSCGTLTQPLNGIANTNTGDVEIMLGDVVTYACNTGYVISHSNSRECVIAGLTETEPTCNLVDCGNLVAPEYGSVTVVLTTYDETADYACNENFTQVGASTRTCLADGSWSPTAPYCEFSCGTLTQPLNGIANTNTGDVEIMLGDIVTYACNTGYVISHSNSRECVIAGLTETEPTCNLVDCGNLDAPEYGSVIVVLTTYDETADYACNENFTQVGASNRTCLADGSWSPSAPYCEFSCGNLTQPMNGIAQTNTGDVEIMLGDIVTYTCNTGYVISHSNSRECVIAGLTETEPTCNLVDCGNLDAPEYGSVIVVLTTYGETADYTCNENFTQVGAPTRTCLADGSWSPTAPYCEFSCGNLTQPLNGIAQTNTGDVEIMLGDIVTYGCNTGYVISHSNSRECVIAGLTDTEPTCSLVDCGSLDAPEYGSVIVVFTTYGETADYTCNENFTQVGEPSRTCSASGDWSSSAPYCEFSCGNLTQLVNGIAQTNSGVDKIMLGDVVTYVCDTGYVISHSKSRECLITGLSETEPTCTKVDCGALADPTNGNVNTSQGTFYGDESVYSCSTDYILQGSRSRSCTANGMWDSTVPVCSEPLPKLQLLYIRPCICVKNRTFTGLTQEQIIAYLVEQTAIDVTNTSLARSKLQCQSDPRASSRTVGYFGIAFMTIIFGSMLVIDILFLFKKRETLNKDADEVEFSNSIYV